MIGAQGVRRSVHDRPNPGKACRCIAERAMAPSLLGELAGRSAKESADYVQQRMGGASV